MSVVFCSIQCLCWIIVKLTFIFMNANMKAVFLIAFDGKAQNPFIFPLGPPLHGLAFNSPPYIFWNIIILKSLIQDDLIGVLQMIANANVAQIDIKVKPLYIL